MSGSCPYSNIMNNIPFFNSNKEEIEEEVITTLDTEKAINNKNATKEIEITGCPYKQPKVEKKSEKEEKCPINEKLNDDSDIEDNTRTGGCPVMNTSNKFKSFYLNILKSFSLNFIKIFLNFKIKKIRKKGST